jgi:crotonobetainyl-CoA:carnitine CoA-transferase CaiB-like acyl-CoA transferase
MAENRPLQGFRVIDFGWILSVPHCNAWLGSFGAEVIRVESQARLDMVRAGLAGSADGIAGLNRSAAFNGINYSKKSITLNIATAEGQALARELIARSDVVCENYATGVMDRLGLGYEALSRDHPELIMLSGSTLGTEGPEREATGWGPNVCAYAGLPSISGYRDGPPADLGGTWPDYCIGTMMVFALLSALHERQRTGRGQHVEVAMGEVVTAMIPEAILDHTMNGRMWPRLGNRDLQMAPHGVFPCAGPGGPWHEESISATEEGQGAQAQPFGWHGASQTSPGGPLDAGQGRASQTSPGGLWSEAQGRASQTSDDDRWVAIAVKDDAAWQQLCAVMGRADLAGDAELATLTGRKRREDEMEAAIGAWTAGRTAWAVTETLQAAGVAAGPVLTPGEVARDPQILARGFLVEMDHPEVGRRTVAGIPAQFSAMPEPAYGSAPCLGEHNDEIFGGLLQLDAGEIRRLQEAHVIY